jgi:hypothetical protein
LQENVGTPCSSWQDCDSKEYNDTIGRDAYHNDPIDDDQKSREAKAQLGLLTVVDAVMARRHQASKPLHVSLVFDASVFLQTSGALCQGISEHQDGIVRPALHSKVARDAVLLTGPDRNRWALSCGHATHSEKVRNRLIREKRPESERLGTDME